MDLGCTKGNAVTLFCILTLSAIYFLTFQKNVFPIPPPVWAVVPEQASDLFFWPFKK